MASKKAKFPTEKMTKLAREVRKGKTLTAAGKAAGYTTRQAASSAFKTIKLRFHDALLAKGYDVDNELTELYAKLKEKTTCTETVFFQSNGIVMETREVIPHGEQRAAANDCLRLIGAIGNGHDDHEPVPVGLRPGHISIQVVLPAGVDPRVLVGISAGSAVRDEQPILDVSKNENARRPGPKPTL